MNKTKIQKAIKSHYRSHQQRSPRRLLSGGFLFLHSFKQRWCLYRSDHQQKSDQGVQLPQKLKTIRLFTKRGALQFPAMSLLTTGAVNDLRQAGENKVSIQRTEMLDFATPPTEGATNGNLVYLFKQIEKNFSRK